MRELVAPLLTNVYSREEIDRYLAFDPDSEAIERLLSAGNAALTKYPPLPGQRVVLNSVWAAFLRDGTDYPVHVVVGDFFIKDEQIYGSELSPSDYASTFSGDTKNSDWDGHCWLSFGDVVGDASIIRTGATPVAHRALRSLVQNQLARVEGVFAARYSDIESIGVRYVPHYALTDDDITAVFKTSMHMVNEPRVN